jgi:4-hydroxybenzoate polyprenyltransferase
MDATTAIPARNCSAIVQLVRFTAYEPLFLLTGLFGALLTFAPLDSMLAVLMIFIASSAAFGFVINDISDRDLDAHESHPRNPLADGTCPLSVAYATGFVLLLTSLICCALLPVPLILLGGLELFIFVTYSFAIEVKNIAGLDLVFHGLFPALYGAMGFVLYRSPDRTAVVYVLLVFTFGAVAEIFNEIRDYEKDRLVRKNFVMVVGRKTAYGITLVLLTLALTGTALFAIINPAFHWLLVCVPFGLLLIQPVWQAMRDERYEKNFVQTVNARGIVLALAMIGIFSVLQYSGAVLPY